jgi:hypothetical protein
MAVRAHAIWAFTLAGVTHLLLLLLLLLLWLQVSAHPNCTIQVTVIGKDWFQVQGVAVEPYDSAVPMSAYDAAAIRRGR